MGVGFRVLRSWVVGSRFRASGGLGFGEWIPTVDQNTCIEGSLRTQNMESWY